MGTKTYGLTRERPVYRANQKRRSAPLPGCRCVAWRPFPGLTLRVARREADGESSILRACESAASFCGVCTLQPRREAADYPLGRPFWLCVPQCQGMSCYFPGLCVSAEIDHASCSVYPWGFFFSLFLSPSSLAPTLLG